MQWRGTSVRGLAVPLVAAREAMGIKILIGLMALALMGPAPSAPADFIRIDFETTPPLLPAPGVFDNLPTQVITVPAIHTLSVGVVLGNPAFIASFAPQGTLPNAYGTAFIGSSTL